MALPTIAVASAGLAVTPVAAGAVSGPGDLAKQRFVFVTVNAAQAPAVWKALNERDAEILQFFGDDTADVRLHDDNDELWVERLSGVRLVRSLSHEQGPVQPNTTVFAPRTDPGSLLNVAQNIRARSFWEDALGLDVVAEGIEDDTTLELLRGFGVDCAQGYGIARPMPAMELPGWLASAHRGSDLTEDALTQLERENR